MTTSTIERILSAAAEARGQAVAQRSHRPSQRRCAEEAGTPAAARVHATTVRLEERTADDGTGLLRFEGFASVYDTGYGMWDMFGPYTEQVTSGAGALTLARSDLDVPFVLAHDSLRRMARTTNGSLNLTEETVDDVTGLRVEAPVLDPADADVAYIAPKLRAGLIDEMSFRFRIDKGSWSPDWSEFHIEQYDLHRGDVAIVGYGANPHTAGAGLRSLPNLDDLTDAQLRKLEHDLHARRAASRDDVDAEALTAPSMSLDTLRAIAELHS